MHDIFVMSFKSSHQDQWGFVCDPVSLDDATKRKDVGLHTHNHNVWQWHYKYFPLTSSTDHFYRSCDIL